MADRLDWPEALMSGSESYVASLDDKGKGAWQHRCITVGGRRLMARKKRQKRSEAPHSRRQGFVYARRPDRRRAAQVHRVSAIVQRIKAFAGRNRMVIRAWLVFFLAIVGCTAILRATVGWVHSVLSVLTAQVTGLILRALGTQNQVSGTLVQSPQFAMQIIPECTGFLVGAIFLSAILAYPCRLRAKVLGVAFGFPAIFLINQVRMVSLYYIGAFFPDFLDAAHFVVWQSLIIFSAVILWLLWVEKFANVPHH
jgi:archaeosortase B (VPXXXP-CTERM-specific)